MDSDYVAGLWLRDTLGDAGLWARASNHLLLTLVTLSASIVLLTLVLRRKRAIHVPTGGMYLQDALPAWRLVRIGLSFWLLEECLRLFHVPDAGLILSHYAGNIAWLLALRAMPQRMIQRTTWLGVGVLVLAMAGAALYMLGWQSLWEFVLIDSVLLLATVPLLTASQQGVAAEERVVWITGLFLRVFSNMLLADTHAAPFILPVVLPLVYYLRSLAYVMLALAMWLLFYPLRLGYSQHSDGLLAAIVLIISLQIGTVWTFLGLRLNTMLSWQRQLLLFGLLSYLSVIMLLILLSGNRNRRLSAEQTMRQWARLLEQLLVFSPDVSSTLSLESVLQGVMKALGNTFDNLCGMALESKTKSQIGEQGSYSFPLVREGALFGHLYFHGAPHNLAMLETAAPLLSNHIYQALSQRQHVSEALTDPLTGLLNRRGFHVRKGKLTSKALSQHRSISVAVLDIDYFKRVNDVYGHSVGDEALCTLAQVMRRYTRKEDLVVRWGGEEFVIVLLGADLPQCLEVMERIRSELRAWSIPPISWPLTVSIGLLQHPAGSAIELEECITIADEALLRAKKHGRDRIELSPLAM